MPPDEYSGPASITPTAEQMGKIRSEMDVVSSNVGVMSDMLTNLKPGEEDPSDWELLRVRTMCCVCCLFVCCGDECLCV